MSFSSHANNQGQMQSHWLGTIKVGSWILTIQHGSQVGGLTQVVSDKAIYIFSVEPVVLGTTGYVEAVVRRFGEKADSGSSQSVSD